MDPDATLREMRAAMFKVRRLVDAEPKFMDALTEAASELHDAAEALDVWLMHGGYLPAEWDHG